MSTADPIPKSLRRQANHCRGLHCAFYGKLLDLCAEDFEAGGVVASLLGSWQGDPFADALALRLLGAVHHWVRVNPDSHLGGYYRQAAAQSMGDDAETLAVAAWPSFRDLLATDHGTLSKWLHSSPPQTNDVQRSAALLIGFLTISRMYNRPLALNEIGASCGLNMYWDRFHYDFGDAVWGDDASPVRITSHLTEGRDLLEVTPKIASQRGCDLNPLRLDVAAERLELESYFWPTPARRFALFQAAAALAVSDPNPVARADAVDWTKRQLEWRAPDCAFVLYHSAFWAYLPRDRQEALERLVASAGRRASSNAPFAWLSLEYPERSGTQELKLTTWPEGKSGVLATFDPQDNAINHTPLSWTEPR